jgi:hypothetical protein
MALFIKWSVSGAWRIGFIDYQGLISWGEVFKELRCKRHERDGRNVMWWILASSISG